MSVLLVHAMLHQVLFGFTFKVWSVQKALKCMNDVFTRIGEFDEVDDYEEVRYECYRIKSESFGTAYHGMDPKTLFIVNLKLG